MPSHPTTSLIRRGHSLLLARRPNHVRSLASAMPSPMTVAQDEGKQHCPTCSCPHHRIKNYDPSEPLPPPLPEPTYSVHRRVLPKILVKLSSHEGRQRLLSVLSKGLADAYWTLTEHSINQSDPAYCGLTTLVMVLNSMSVDPQIRWRGGWRYFGDEDVLLSRCCLNPERVRRIGITLEEFQQLARCQGLSVKLKRPDRETNTLEHFRNDIRQLLLQPSKSVLVVSYSRPALGQTGDGHFSPVAAYHEETDSVLVLDVARFKYPPYFVSVPDLYNAMIPLDQASQKSRGWFVMTPPRVSASYHDPDEEDEHLRPASLVPAVGDADVCPVAKVKVEFCKSRTSNRQNNNLSKQELSSSGSLFSNR